jgi:hypothetical protein
MNIWIEEVIMLDMTEEGSVRDERGRFVPGVSGNPAGKAPGTRNRVTMLRAALDSEEGPAMARVIIDKALAGDVVTAKFCLDRLEPKPRNRAIEIDLPAGATARDLVAAFDETVRAMAAGEITPDEAVQVTRVLDGRRKAIEAAWREEMRDERLFVGAGFYPARGESPLRRSPPAVAEKPRAAQAGQSPAPTNRRGPSGEESRGMDGASLASLPFRGGKTNLLHSTCISRSPPRFPDAAAPSISAARGDPAAFRRQLADQPVGLQRVGEPRLGPAALDAGLDGPRADALAVPVEERQLAAGLIEAAGQPGALRGVRRPRCLAHDSQRASRHG